MPVKIRLQRHGKKGKPFYWVVAADSRAKRDGKYLEKLGTYNPNTNPATINLDIDGSVKWLQNGAKPTDTARNILSYKGVMLKHHLLGGVRKGALTEEQMEEKFNDWLEEKESKISDKVSGLDKQKEKERAEALKAEKEINEKRIAETSEAEAPESEEPSAEPIKAEAASEENEAAATETSSSDQKDAKQETEPKKDESAEHPEEKKETEAKKQESSDEPAETQKADKVGAAKEEEPANSDDADSEANTDKQDDPKAATKEVVETPKAPQPDEENAEDNFAAPVVEKEILKETEGITDAPSVQEVVSDEDFEKKDADKPKPAEDDKK